ncbi:TPA: hypothetical protein OZI11_002476 [Staphylococcus aureus]|nr:hypothetical protein [Staphylococcus aureus]
MEKNKNVFKAIVELDNGSFENYLITAGGIGGADRILSKYIRDYKIRVTTMKINKLDGEKAQIARTRLYSIDNELLLEAPYLVGNRIVRGFNWRGLY